MEKSGVFLKALQAQTELYLVDTEDAVALAHLLREGFSACMAQARYFYDTLNVSVPEGERVSFEQYLSQVGAALTQGQKGGNKVKV